MPEAISVAHVPSAQLPVAPDVTVQSPGQDGRYSIHTESSILTKNATERSRVVLLEKIPEDAKGKIVKGLGIQTDESVTEMLTNAFLATCKKLANSNTLQFITTLLTLYALFGDDIRLSVTEKSQDHIFDMLTITCIVLFSTEIFVCSFGKLDYYMSFFYILDVISTSSLFLDITGVSEALFTNENAEASDSSGIARAGRAGRAGTRVGRVVRIIRIIRLVRIFKLYKAHLERKRKMEQALLAPGERNVFQEDEDDENTEESRVGKKLSEMTTRRVIVLVLVMLFTVPIFSSDGLFGKETYMSAPTFGLNSVWDSYRTYVQSKRDVENFSKEYDDWAAEYNNSTSNSTENSTEVNLTNRTNVTKEEYSSTTVWSDFAPAGYDALKNPIPGNTTYNDLVTRRDRNRRGYEKRLLHTLYYHHADYNEPHATNKVFWIGYLGDPSRSVLSQELTRDARLGDTTNYPGAVPLSEWGVHSETFPFDGIDFPADVKKRLQKTWNNKCTGKVATFREGGFLQLEAREWVRYGVALGRPRGVPCPIDLRYQEVESMMPMSDEDKDMADVPGIEKELFVIYFEQTTWTTIEASLNMLQTVFVVFVLGIGSAMFSKDANNLVLYPVERMITKLNRIRKNPFEAIRMSEEEIRRETGTDNHTGDKDSSNRVDKEKTRKHAAFVTTEQLQELVKQAKKRESVVAKIRRLRAHIKKIREDKKNKGQKLMETVILEKTIIKLGGLCALAFGEAGSAVIAHNMKVSDTTSAIRTMVDGQFIDAVFGFCDIRNFTDATEILQDAVMLFVNQISEVVHTVVDQHCGSPNKNIGDAFLLVWRLGYTTKDEIRSAGLDTLHAEDAERIGELSVLCFLRVIASTNRSPILAMYRLHEGLLARMPNYRVKMGFGLHRGWAIEGAIGSEFKIDASYLSPNVNLSAQLEAATKQYGVPMLVSEMLVRRLTPRFRKLLRRVDRVMVGGFSDPLYLYTVDMEPNALRIYELPTATTAPKTTPRPKMRAGGAVIFDGKGGIQNQMRRARASQRGSLKVGRVVNQETGKVSTFTGKRLMKKDEFMLRLARETRKKNFMEPDFSVVDEYLADEDIRRMTERFTPDLHHRFSMAFVNYEAGEWRIAKEKLEDLRNFLPEPAQEEEVLHKLGKGKVPRAGSKDKGRTGGSKDKPKDSGATTSAKLQKMSSLKKMKSRLALESTDGPSECLLGFMKTYDFEAPADWAGYRILTGV